MKKIIAITLLLVCFFALVGCGSSKKTEDKYMFVKTAETIINVSIDSQTNAISNEIMLDDETSFTISRVYYPTDAEHVNNDKKWPLYTLKIFYCDLVTETAFSVQYYFFAEGYDKANTKKELGKFTVADGEMNNRYTKMYLGKKIGQYHVSEISFTYAAGSYAFDYKPSTEGATIDEDIKGIETIIQSLVSKFSTYLSNNNLDQIY